MGKSNSKHYQQMKMETEKNGLSASGLEVRTRSGWKLRKSDMRENTEPSMTVQNQAFSIRDLLVKQSNGLNVATEYNPVDFQSTEDDIDIERVMRSDIHDQELVLKNNLDRIGKMKKQLEELAKPKPAKQDERAGGEEQEGGTKPAK